MEKNIKNIIVVLFIVMGFGAGYFIGVIKAPTVSNNSMFMSMTGMRQMFNGAKTDNSSQPETRSMDQMMASMNSDLVNKTGDEFDKTFLSEMMVHHQGAVAMAETALKNAKHQEIKDLASAIITAQNQEISEMKSWQNSWYGTSTGGTMMMQMNH